MAEETYQTDSNEEEYQFNDEEEYQASEADDADLFGVEPKKPSWKERLADPRIRTGLIILAGVLLIFWGLRALFSSGDAEEATEQVRQEERMPLAPVAELTPTVSNQELEQELAVLAESAQEQRGNLIRVERRIGELNGQLRGLQKNNEQLVELLQLLSQQLMQQTEQLNQLIEQTKFQQQEGEEVIEEVEPELPTYHIQAMIPGRAWLFKRGAGGAATITVARGDILPGYGQVVSIDPSRGIITMDSGETIGYAPGDS